MLGFLIAWATGNLDKYMSKADYPPMPKVKQPPKRIKKMIIAPIAEKMGLKRDAG